MVFHSDILPGVLLDIVPWLLAVVVFLLAVFGWNYLRKGITPRERRAGRVLLAIACFLFLALGYRGAFLTTFYVHVWNGEEPHANLHIKNTAYDSRGERWQRLYVLSHRHSELEFEITWKEQIIRKRLPPLETVVNLDPRQSIALSPALFTYQGANFGPGPPDPTTIGLDARTADSLGCEEFLDIDRVNEASVPSHQSSKTICRILIEKK